MPYLKDVLLAIMLIKSNSDPSNKIFSTEIVIITLS